MTLPDGTVLDIYDQPFADIDGSLMILEMDADITERKQAERQMTALAQEVIAAREDERRQVATALHHDVGSLAVGLSACVGAIHHALDDGKVAAALRIVERSKERLEQSISRLKEVATVLRPPELDLLGLRVALRQHCIKMSRLERIRVRFTHTLGSYSVNGSAATALFRIAQEAINNALRHGRAHEVRVHLAKRKIGVSLTVRDDGTGFDVSRHPSPGTTHMGLSTMREMANSEGGSFLVESARGKGTVVRVHLPLTAREAIHPPGNLYPSRKGNR